MRKLIASLAVLGALAGGLVVGPATPAAQAAGLSDCPSTRLCVWYDAGFTGSRYQFAGNNLSWHAWGIADDDSSWYNHGTSGQNVHVYKNINYNTTTICVHWNVSYASSAVANDKGSSNLWGGC